MSVNAVVKAIKHGREMLEDPYGLLKYEAYNRYIVIDPIIRALGWKTEDPNQFMVEWRRGKKRIYWVDYAFFNHDVFGDSNCPVMLIEAKGLGKLKSRPKEQLSKYVQGRRPESLKVGVVTDGREWVIYNLAKRGGLDKEESRVHIIEESLLASAKKLNAKLSKNAIYELT